MTDVLNDLIAASHEGAVELQVVVGGQMLAGAVREHKPGVFELLTVGQHPQTGRALPIRTFFRGENCTVIFVPPDSEDEPRILTPKGRNTIPGIS